MRERDPSAGSGQALAVLADVPDEARAMREVPFGPLALLLNRVRSLDEAVEKANVSSP